jgi:hypothetical protein
MKYFLLALLVFCFVLIGCEGPTGPAGLMLVKTYTGVITGATWQVIDIPEIKNKSSTTFIMAYASFASSPNMWYPISDGLSDDYYSMILLISWTSGTAWIYEGWNGYYMINVYQVS